MKATHTIALCTRLFAPYNSEPALLESGSANVASSIVITVFSLLLGR